MTRMLPADAIVSLRSPGEDSRAGSTPRKGNKVDTEPRHRAIILVRVASPEVISWLRDQIDWLEAHPHSLGEFYVGRLV